jgi:hypothetical protein
MYTIRFNIRKLQFAHTECICVFPIVLTATVSLNSINRLGSVGTGIVNIIQTSFRLECVTLS